MRGWKIAAVALCAAVWIGAPVAAQSLRAISGPSELPPPGFKSDQFVDSRGCVFIRAGYGGTTTWVPRVGNNRKPVCGQKASAAPVVVAEPARVVAAAPVVARPVVQPVVAVQPTAAVQPAASGAALPAARPAARVAATVAPESYVAARVATAAPAAKPASERMKVQLVANPAQCPGPIAGIAERQLSDGRRVVACGEARSGVPVYLLVGSGAKAVAAPAPVVRAGASAAAAAPVRAEPVRAVAPALQVAAAAPAQCDGLARINQLFLVDDGRLVVKCGKGATYLVVGRADVAGVVTGATGAATAGGRAAAPLVPKGYKLAWTDGRLSTTRGSQSAAGDAAMRLVWSDDTPRRLIDRTSGKDVTMDFAYLEYPYTSLSDQKTGRLSAMNAPAATAGGRFVQVGSFGVAANATAAAARLKAAGLPVQISAITRNGKSLQIVLAGPFAGQEQVAMALAKTRASGFDDAFARN